MQAANVKKQSIAVFSFKEYKSQKLQEWQDVLNVK